MKSTWVPQCLTMFMPFYVMYVMLLHLLSPSRLPRSDGRQGGSALVPSVEGLCLRVEWHLLDTTVSHHRHSGREEENASLAVLFGGRVESNRDPRDEHKKRTQASQWRCSFTKVGYFSTLLVFCRRDRTM